MTEPTQNSFQSDNGQLPEEKDKESKIGKAGQLEEIEKLIAEKEEYLAGWKRAKADFINYKKDELRRLEEIAKFGNEDLIRDLITVLDSFDLAILALESQAQNDAEQTEAVPLKEGHYGAGAEKPKTKSNWQGMYMIRSQLEGVLKKKGLERIMISVGQPFDPALHESIASVESDLKSGTVVEEVERGYTLYGRIIRPARVKIAK